MAEAWLPGAVCVRAGDDGGRLSGGAPRVVWHTAESDPRTTSVRSVADQLNELNLPTHVVWNPLTGETAQLIPVTRAARGLNDTAHGTGPNHEGRLCVQVAVIGFASVPFTSGPLRNLESIMGWLDSWGVARTWPAGRPARANRPQGSPAHRSRRQWAKGGHFGHSQVPGTHHVDPGAIEIERIVGFDTHVPRPRLAPVAGTRT